MLFSQGINPVGEQQFPNHKGIVLNILRYQNKLNVDGEPVIGKWSGHVSKNHPAFFRMQEPLCFLIKAGNVIKWKQSFKYKKKLYELYDEKINFKNFSIGIDVFLCDGFRAGKDGYTGC